MNKEVQLTIGNIVGIIAGTILLTGFLIGAIFSIEVTQTAESNPWLGSTGYFPFALSVGTIVLLSIGAWHAARTFRHTRRAEVATRFQKGAEMLGAVSTGTKIAGIYVLRDIALDWKETYQSTVLNTIAAHIAQNDKEVKASLAFYGATNPLQPPARSDRSTLRALALIAELNPTPTANWPARSATKDGRFLVQELFAAQIQRDDENYSSIEFRHCFFGEFWMIGCDLIGSKMSAQIFDKIVLRGCNLTGMEFTFSSG